MLRQPTYSIALILITLVATMGCGGAESSVYGTVSLDGVSLDHGSVTFTPTSNKGRTAAGRIYPNGKYVVEAARSGGLPSGEYVVTVFSRAPSIPHPLGGPSTPGKLLTPERYRDSNSSGIEFTVKPGSNRIDLELSSG